MLLRRAVIYLTNKKSKRPLWVGQKNAEGFIIRPASSLYPALSSSERLFKGTLNAHYHKWVGDNDEDKDKKKPVKANADPNDDIDYPKEFLNDFARRLNIPNVPPGYCLLTNSGIPSKTINKHIPKGVKAIEEEIGSIGLAVLGKNGEETIAFPVAFLERLQVVIKEDSSLKGDRLIAKAVLEYIKYLEAAEITEACMNVSSLALQKKNLEAFRESGLFEQLIEQLTQ